MLADDRRRRRRAVRPRGRAPSPLGRRLVGGPGLLGAVRVLGRLRLRAPWRRHAAPPAADGSTPGTDATNSTIAWRKAGSPTADRWSPWHDLHPRAGDLGGQALRRADEVVAVAGEDERGDRDGTGVDRRVGFRLLDGGEGLPVGAGGVGEQPEPRGRRVGDRGGILGQQGVGDGLAALRVVDDLEVDARPRRARPSGSGRPSGRAWSTRSTPSSSRRGGRCRCRGDRAAPGRRGASPAWRTPRDRGACPTGRGPGRRRRPPGGRRRRAPATTFGCSQFATRSAAKPWSSRTGGPEPTSS